jgi:ATP-dependent helicase/DNAse subunit B
VWQDLLAWRGRDGWPRRIGVDAPALLKLLFSEQRVFSPSELETYAACPFRYFGARVLGLEEREPDRTRLHYGSLVHRVLQNLYDEERRRFAGPEDHPLPALQVEHFTQVVELFETQWQLLSAGLLPPDLRTLFACNGGVLQLFLEAIALVESEYGNLLVEFVLRDAQGQPVLMGSDRDERAVFLRGKIDRVDVSRTQRSLAIISDYKTGRAMPNKERAVKLADGRLLQLPLYAAALQRVRPDLEVVGGAYIHLSERPQSEEPSARRAIAAVGALLKDDKAPQAPLDAEAARLKALDMVGAIRAGKFPLTDHANGKDFAECTWFCPMRHACRHPEGYQGRYRF